MTDEFAELLNDEEDEETIEELKKNNKTRHKNFASIINKKKLNKYELDDVMF